MPILNDVSFEALSENSLLISWPEIICPQQHQLITQLQECISIELKKNILESIAAYNSLIIYYRFTQISLNDLIDKIKELITSISIESLTAATLSNNKNIEIPVYYGSEAGWDLTSVAQQTGLSVEQVIEQHSQTNYRAYALGFSPGFCYLASVPSCLALPRKQTPRIKVPKGAVAIAEQQTAIYPTTSPGGWHIIGQTPQRMFEFNNNDFYSTINVGDNVTFKAISLDEFHALDGSLIKEDP